MINYPSALKTMNIIDMNLYPMIDSINLPNLSHNTPPNNGRMIFGIE